MAVDADVLRSLSISAGFGADMFDPADRYTCQCSGGLRQAALMPHLRLPLFDRATFVTMGVGVSRDPHPNVQGVSTVVRQDDELGLEHRFENGVRARAFAGIGLSTNRSDLPPFSGALYFGAALGYAVVPNPDRSLVPSGIWYGWQPLISDAIAVIVGVNARRSQEAIRYALAIYAVPPAVVHVSHHNYGRAIASATLRGLLPYLLWSAARPDENGQTDEATPIAGGAIIAGLLDDLLLSWI